MLLLFQGSSAGLAGTLNLTEAADAASAVGALAISGALASAEAGDTVSSAGIVLVKGTLSRTEASDTVSSTGILPLKAAGNIVEANDTSAAAGTLALVGAAAIIEGNDTLAAPAIVPVSAQLAVTEDSDGISSSFFPVLQMRPRGGPWPVPDDAPVWRRDLWDLDLRRVIEEAWRVANGEIDPVTRLELPPPPEPDYAAIHKALAARAIAAEKDQVDQIFAAQEQARADEAVAILLLAA